MFNPSGLQAKEQVEQCGPLATGPGATREDKPPPRPILNPRQYHAVNSAREYSERTTFKHDQQIRS